MLFTVLSLVFVPIAAGALDFTTPPLAQKMSYLCQCGSRVGHSLGLGGSQVGPGSGKVGKLIIIIIKYFEMKIF